jgi:hypothetical protein
MNKILAFEMILFGLIVVGLLAGFLSLDRTGQLFLALGLIDLLMSLAAWRSWPVLRGDISNQGSLTRQDVGEADRSAAVTAQDRPSPRFIVLTAVTGIFAIGVGALLLLGFAR